MHKLDFMVVLVNVNSCSVHIPVYLHRSLLLQGDRGGAAELRDDVSGLQAVGGEGDQCEAATRPRCPPAAARSPYVGVGRGDGVVHNDL